MRLVDNVWSTFSKFCPRVFAAAFVITFGAAMAWPQVESTIFGLVQDSSGAAVPNATVRITIAMTTA